MPLEIGIRRRFVVAFPARTRRGDLAVDFAGACHAVSGRSAPDAAAALPARAIEGAGSDAP